MKIFKSVASHAVFVYNKLWINRHTSADICAASSVRIQDVTQLYFSKSACQTGPTKWNQTMHLDEVAWKRIFNSLKNTCKEVKLKEFQFKLIHRIVVTKKELFRYGIKTDDECLYCGEHDSIDHTFSDCEFVEHFVKNVIDWFNAVNNCQRASRAKTLGWRGGRE